MHAVFQNKTGPVQFAIALGFCQSFVESNLTRRIFCGNCCSITTMELLLTIDYYHNLLSGDWTTTTTTKNEIVLSCLLVEVSFAVLKKLKNCRKSSLVRCQKFSLVQCHKSSLVRRRCPCGQFVDKW